MQRAGRSFGQGGAYARAPQLAPPIENLRFICGMVYGVSDVWRLVMDLRRYDEILGMYSAGVLLKDISVQVGVHVNVVQRYVAEGRRRGDVRAEYRRKPGSSVPNLVLYLLQQNVEVSWDDLRVSLWPVDEDRPSTWRTIVRVAIGDLRKRGLVIESDRSINGYRLVA